MIRERHAPVLYYESPEGRAGSLQPDSLHADKKETEVKK